MPAYRFRALIAAVVPLLAVPALAQKSEPANVYLFPAGAQRGTSVEASLEGENVTGRCDFHLTPGRGVTAAKEAVGKRIKLDVAAGATPGVVMWRIATAQGGTGSRGFAIGEYPEVLERESGSEEAEGVKLPVTVNGRINPDGDVDRYSVELKAGQPFSAEVMAARLGGPIDTNCFVGQFGNPPSDVAYMQLDSSLELYGPDGRLLTQAEDTFGLDPALGLIAPQSGRYTVLVRHMAMAGMPQFVYRLTLAEKPLLMAAYPAGGQRGTTLSTALVGQGFAAGARQEVKLEGLKRTGSYPLQSSEWPEILEAEPNDSGDTAPAVTLPAVLNGRLQKAADSDLYRVSLKKGEAWRFEAFLRRLGSPTDASLSVLDAKGAMLATADAPVNGDAELIFSPPADGDYLLQIRESAMSRLGERLVYRLYASPQMPDYRVLLNAEFVDLAPGAAGEVEASVKRLGGFAGAVTISVDGLPEGVTAEPLVLAGNMEKAKLKLTAAKGGRSGSWLLKVVGTAEVSGQPVSRTASAPVANPAESGLGSAPRTVEDLLLTVRFPAPFKFDADDFYLFLNLGSVHQAKVFIERDPGFTGPIQLSVADRLPRNPYGIHFVPTVVTDLGKEAFIPMVLPQGPRGNEISRTHVKAEAVVKGADGREWHVLQTAKKNTVCRCLAPLLSLAVQPDATRAKRDSTVRLKFALGRTASSMAGAEIRLLSSAEVKGVTMEPVAVIAGESEVNGTLKIAADADLGQTTELWFEVTSKRDTGQTIFYQAKLIFDLKS